MKSRDKNWQPKWVALPILDFARVVFSFKDRPAEGWEWVEELADALVVGDIKSGCDFANALIEDATARFMKKSASGTKGGIASAKTRNARRANPDAPKSKQEVLDFAADNGLDVDDARLWYERNFIERPGCDKYGEVIRNWKGALVAACKADRERREEENEDDDRF